MPSLHRPLRAALLCAAASTLLSDLAQAAPAPAFPELLRQAQMSAPRLAESRANIEQAKGLAEQAAARPNPTASVLVENFGGSRSYSQLGGQTTFQVDQTVELGGKRAARTAAGRAGLDAARARDALASVEFAAELATAYMAAEAGSLRAQYANDTLALALEDARIAAALVKSGKEADVRAAQARASLQAAKAAVESAQADRDLAYAKLTALVGATTPITSIPTGLLMHADRPEGRRQAVATDSPAVRAAQADRDAAAHRVRVERAKALPDLTVSVGVRRLAGEGGATAMVGGVSAPLPLFDQNRGAVSAAGADLNAAEARLRAAQLDAEAEGRVAWSRFQAGQSRVSAAREGEIAAADAYRLTRLGYEGGKLPLLEVLSARRALSEAWAQALDARLDRLNSEISLARLQGVAPFGDQP